MLFYEWSNMAGNLLVLAFFVALVVLNELTRRSKIFGIGFFVVFPIIATIFIWPHTVTAESGVTSWFHWAKTYSALAGCVGFMAIRYIPKLQKNKIALCFPPLILVINIMEAVVRDFQAFGINEVTECGLIIGGPWNILNGIAGILNALTVCGWMGIYISKDKSQDMMWPDMCWFWIVAYDLWNYAYVYNTSSDRSTMCGIALLASCTFVAFVIKKGAWLQHRAHTLAIYMMTLFTFPSLFTTPELMVYSTNSPVAHMLISGLALAFNVGVAIYEIYTISKYKKNLFKEELYTHLKCYQEVAEN